MEPAAPSRTRWASEEPLADWRGAPHRLFPQRAPKPDAKAPAPPKQGAVQPGMRLRLGREGLREKRNAEGAGGSRDGGWVRGAADPAGPAPSTMPSAQLHPRAARPTPACAPPARGSPKRRRCSGPGRLPAASSLRAAPGTRGFGFQPAEPRFAPPAGSTRPPGPEQGRVTLLHLRSASRCSPASVAARAGAPRPAPCAPVSRAPPRSPPSRPFLRRLPAPPLLSHLFPRRTRAASAGCSLGCSLSRLTVSDLPLFPWKPFVVSTQASPLLVPAFETSVSISLSIPQILSDSFLLTAPVSSSRLKLDSEHPLPYLSFIQPTTEGICLVPDSVLDTGNTTVNNPKGRP